MLLRFLRFPPKSCAILLAFALFQSCGEGQASSEEKKAIALFAEVRARSVSENGPWIVFTVNPNDCFRCVNLLHERLQKAIADTGRPHNMLIVLREKRKVEREQLLKTVLEGIDASRAPVVWDDVLYEAVENEYGGAKGQSLLLIYDEKGNKILCKPVKELNGSEKELDGLFDR